jgi:hypothetical protein
MNRTAKKGTAMEPAVEVDDAILDAIAVIQHYVREVAGDTPTQPEIARALKRYFVLKEITEHIVMEWDGED